MNKERLTKIDTELDVYSALKRINSFKDNNDESHILCYRAPSGNHTMVSVCNDSFIIISVSKHMSTNDFVMNNMFDSASSFIDSFKQRR